MHRDRTLKSGVAKISSGRAAFGLALLLWAGPGPGAVRVDGLAVLVGKQPLTLQDVYFFRSVQRLQQNETRHLTLPETGKALGQSIRKLLFEEMVLREIRSQGYEEGRGAEFAEKALRSIEAKNGRELKSLLRVYAKNDAAVKEALKRSFLVETFVQKKAETLAPGVTDADVDRYLRQNAAKVQGDAAKLRGTVAAALRKERIQQGLEEWIRGLRDKYQVVHVLNDEG